MVSCPAGHPKRPHSHTKSGNAIRARIVGEVRCPTCGRWRKLYEESDGPTMGWCCGLLLAETEDGQVEAFDLSKPGGGQ